MKDGDKERLDLEETVPAPGGGADALPPGLPALGSRYEVLRTLGAGGVGTVLLARHVELDRLVAVKVLHAQAVRPDPDALERFRREAQVTARLAHPNIVAVHDFDVAADGTPFLVMEHLEGESLGSHIRRAAPVPPRRVVAMLKEVADALDRAHEAGVVHRDIKPANLFLTEGGRVKILDFGICFLADAAARLTSTRAVVGTPLYMAPEQLSGQGVGPATDQYALALVAYEMLCGRPAFQVETTGDVIKRLVSAPARVDRVVEGLPRGLGRALESALDPDPGRRFPLVSALVDAMEQALGPEGPGPGGGGRPRKGWRAGKVVRRLLPAAAVLAVVVSVGGIALRWDGEEVPAFRGLPEAVCVAVLPLEHEAQRELDRAVWPLSDRMIFNALMARRRAGVLVELVDPLAVERELARRELSPPFGEEAIQELEVTLGADVVIGGKVGRSGGRVSMAVTLYRSGTDERVEVVGAGEDAFAAARGVADAVRGALGLSTDLGRMPRLPRKVGASWEALVRDPWTERRYGELAEAPGRRPEESFVRFAEALRDRAGQCRALAEAAGGAYPEEVGGLAAAVCSFRLRDTKEAWAQGLAAYRSPSLRRLAARFLSKLQISGVELAEQIRMARERTSLFPDDASGWWMLATVYSRADEEEALQQTVRIADALSQGEELSFPELLSAARLAMQAGSLAEAARWVAKLDVARPETEWEVMWRACRKSALLQLRGRFGEAQQVLAAALGQLASPPGDPYTIVATALFYSHLYFGSLETASQVAAEYAGAFDDRSKPDHWAAQMLGVALAAHREEWPDERIRSEGERVGEALSASAGGLGRKEREASLCLLLSHAASAAEGRRLALAADPENTMVAGCRFLSGQALAEKGLHEEAAGQFARARKEMLYRGDWYLELYLPTLLGEAQAREKAGEAEAARGLYEEIVEAYANADRELAEVAEAKDSLKRLAGH